MQLLTMGSEDLIESGDLYGTKSHDDPHRFHLLRFSGELARCKELWRLCALLSVSAGLLVH